MNKRCISSVLLWALLSCIESHTAVAAGDVLEEIVVTAEKREENLQKTPVAITALMGDDLQMQAKNTMEDALRTVPGVNIKSGSNAGSTTVVIRGIQAAANTDPTVTTNEDGIYQSNPGSSPLFDLARVEVLKGPQGTLYGRNATGGVVNIITNDPSSQLGALVTGTVGNYSLVRTEASVNLPVNESLATRAAFLYSKHDGYLTNGANDEDIVAGRLKALFKPSARLSVLLSGEFDRARGHGQGSVPSPFSAQSNPWNTPDPAGGYSSDKTSLYAVINWDLGFGVLTAEPSYYYLNQIQDLEITGADQGLVQGATRYKQSSLEVRLAQSESSSIKWQAGFFGLNNTATPYLTAPLVDVPIRSSSPTGLFQPSLTAAQALAAPGTLFRRPIGAGGQSATIAKADAWAVFGQTTVPVTTALRLTAGARYTHDGRSKINQIINGFGVESSPYAAQVVTNPGTAACTKPLTTSACKQSADFHAVTGKLGLEYDLREASLLYIDVAKGFKAGGLNILPVAAGFSDAYEPETVIAYEAGSKNRFLDQRLQVNVDAYYYDYKDKQLLVAGPPIPPNPLPSVPVLNVGKATIYGFEAANELLITEHDKLSASVAYTHSNVDEAPPATFAYLINRPLPNAPQWIELLGYNHTFNLNGNGTLEFGGLIRFYSSTQIDINFARVDSVQAAYHESDLRLTYTSPMGGWTASAFVNNLEDKAVRSAAFSNTRLLIEPPRTYGVAVSAKF